jgi:hypothetical protein
MVGRREKACYLPALQNDAIGPFRRSQRYNTMSEIGGERTWRGHRNLVEIDPKETSGAEILPPIVDDEDAGAAITGIIMPMHGHALGFCAKSASNKMSIGFVPRHIRPGQ